MTQPQITLDMKKNRMRIHKNTMKTLDYPDYIYILVNPGTKKIVITKAKQSDKDAIHIPKGVRSYCDIYSTELMEKISELNENITINVSYRLSGEERKDHVIFDIRIIERI